MYGSCTDTDNKDKSIIIMLSRSSTPLDTFFFLFAMVGVCICRHTVIHSKCRENLHLSPSLVPKSSPSRGGDVAVYVFSINKSSLLTPFYSVRVSVSVFMALSTAFHSRNSPDNSLLSHSVLRVLFQPYRSFQVCVSLRNSLSALIHQLTN